MKLKYVSKRNGQLQDFDLSKLIEKAVWAADGLPLVDWRDCVLRSIENIDDEKITTKKLDQLLIDSLIQEGQWEYNVAAGRIALSNLRKSMWWVTDGLCDGLTVFPTILQVHQHLVKLGVMINLGYTDEEYAELEQVINHRDDEKLAYFQITQLTKKYGLQNTVTRKIYETPQYVFMRVAMTAAQHSDKRVEDAATYYREMCETVCNPTPNYVNMGTSHAGYTSCCIYTSSDDKRSLAAGKHIATVMTYQSAGIGNSLHVRSVDDPIRGGAIKHHGKERFYFSLGGDVTEFKQGSRSGACTTYFNIIDPDARDLMMLQNPRTIVDRQNRMIQFAVTDHPWFARLVQQDKEFTPFNAFTAPDVYKAFYSADQAKFEYLYSEWEKKNRHIPKDSARELATLFMGQRYDVGTLFWFNVHEANRHTPFLDTVHSSNLCTEVMEPQKPYKHVTDLYKESDDVEGEVALCNLAAIVLPKVMTKVNGRWIIDDAKYRKAVRTALEICRFTIDNTYYELPHVGYTAKRRRNAGVGMIGLATVMAAMGLRYDTVEGRNFARELSETHMWHLCEVNLEMGQKYGVAPWMNKTKWPLGWVPAQTYNRNMDNFTTVRDRRDWPLMSRRLVQAGGGYFSVLSSLQPTESSSKGTPYPNGVYPIREPFLRKTDGSNAIEWVVYTGDDIRVEDYQIAWDVKPTDLILFYGALSIHLDQGGSYDTYRDRRVDFNLKQSDLLQEYSAMHYAGMKSVYYANSITTNQKTSASSAVDCGGGACKM